MNSEFARQGSRKLREQQLLFSEESLLPTRLPRKQDLKPAQHLASIFDECHNYIYANEGLLKDKIFQEVVKLLVIKLHDERDESESAKFGITQNEYRDLLASKPSAFEKRIHRLYDTVRLENPTLLTDEALRLTPLTLGHVVGILQAFSLSQTSGDIKGEAFQSFVYRHQRGDRGEFFTPHPIVRLAVEMIAPRPSETTIDPACGSGGFLIQAIRFIERNHPRLEQPTYVRNCVRGIEFNPDVALAAMIRLTFEGGLGQEVICANALVENASLENQFDVVLTNPPFGSKGKVEDQRILKSYILARKWTKDRMENWKPTNVVLPGQSPDILFIEKCLKVLKPGGRMAIVLPDGILQNVSNSHVRSWVRSQAKVLAVVSIPQEAFVPYGTGIKTSLVILQKNPATELCSCFMARVQKIGYDVKGQPLYMRDASGRLLYDAQGLPMIDDDVNKIVAAYFQWRKGEVVAQSDTIYPTLDSDLNSRLDAEHYRPSDLQMVDWLEKSGGRLLGEIATIVNETDDFRLDSGSEIRYIAISDVDARTMQVVSQQILTAHDAPSRASYRVRHGDIITATSGASTGTSRQATALIAEDEEGAICSNGFAVLRDFHGVEPFYLLAYMRTDFFLRQVRRLMTGHAIPAISADDLAKIIVPLPPKHQQARIAAEIASLMSMRKQALKAGERIILDTETIIRDSST